MPVLICYLLSYDRMRFLHSLSRILSKAKIAGLLQSLLGGGYAKHCHVNTKKKPCSSPLFKSVFISSKHGDKVSLPWPQEGFRFAVARD